MKMNRSTLVIAAVGIAASVLTTTSAFADATVDVDGVGFVGKGDVQSIYDWNNSSLQANASKVQFRFGREGETSWMCEGYNGANRYTLMKKTENSTGLYSDITYSARKNTQGQITGFVLTGMNQSTLETEQLEYCPPAKGWVVQPTLVAGSLLEEGDGEPTLQVSIGDGTWYNLVVTY